MEIRNYTTDVAIIGGGGAALRAAIEASEKGQKVILVDKGRPGRSGATPCALWSVQAPFGPRGQDERDSPEQYFEDMVTAGRFIGDQNIVEVVAFTACDRMLDLERYGVHFKKHDDGRFYQTTSITNPVVAVQHPPVVAAAHNTNNQKKHNTTYRVSRPTRIQRRITRNTRTQFTFILI